MYQLTADGLNNMARYLNAPAESTMGLKELATSSSGLSSSGPVAEESEAKRRKIRKGTHSCWECKRRKTRCVFDNAAEDALCFGCQRRGTTCVSQEFPEDDRSGRHARQMGDRIVRVEALVEQLVRTVGNSSGGEGGKKRLAARGGSTGSGPVATSEPGIDAGAGTSGGERGASLGVLTPDHSGSESVRLFGIYSTSVDGLEDEGFAATDANGTPFARNLREPGGGDPPLAPPAGKFVRISQMLHAALPSHEDALALCALGGGVAVYPKQVLSRPYDHLSYAGWDSPEVMAELPGPDVHPVLLAKKLLYLSILLQYSGTEFYATLQMSRVHGLTHQQAMARMADIAIDNVTTNDELICSMDGLECVMLESVFHGNWGNLRREWMAIRRAMVLAQLMGLHKGPGNHQPLKVLDPTQRRIFPAHLWFRIVFADRCVSMMLGLPQGSLDRGMANEALLANETPMGRLERLQCVIASRIVERNESGASLANSLAATHQIDMELQRVAKVIPAKWWLVPMLAEVMSDPEAMFYATVRLKNQIFHYGMLIHLHLPYMLSFSPAGSYPHDDDDGCGARVSTSSAQRLGGTYSEADHRHHSKFEYSKVTCVNASRDVLSRYIAYRGVNRVAFCCRSVDFFALIASMALLLAHLDNHSARARAMQTTQQQHRVLAAEDTAVDDIGVATAGMDGVQLNYRADFLGHSRLSDRGMMEQVLENMDSVSHVSADVVSRKSAEVLRRLLEMEGEAAEGTADYMATPDESTDMWSSQHVQRQGNVDSDFSAHAAREGERDSGDPERFTATSVEQCEGVLKMCIPYFGIIKIAKEGTLISKETPKAVKTGTAAYVDVPPLPQTPIAETRQQSAARFPGGFNNVSPPDRQRQQRHSRPQERPGRNIDDVQPNTATKNTFTADIGLELLSPTQQQQQHLSGSNLPQQSGRDPQLDEVAALPLTFSGTGLRSTNLVEDTVRQNMNYPGLAADINDWAFQGVDMAFFDSLMRGAAPPQPAESGGGAVGQQW